MKSSRSNRSRVASSPLFFRERSEILTRIERLRDKANSLPLSPGVYIMKNKSGDIIYVGKSKKLKNRVTSYFVDTEKTIKTARMVSLVEDFDYIVCSSEIEALTLENVLIKKHTPKYNIRLKDAKSYPYIKVSQGEFPKLTVTRERKGDKARYFGPYSGMSQAYGAMRAVMKVFSLPDCKRVFPRDIGKDRPCLYKAMGRCVAPCDRSICAEDYRELIKKATAVLSGNARATIDELTREMMAAAEEMEFERAAKLRDSIDALRGLSEKQKVVGDGKLSRDVFAIAASGSIGALAMLSIRSGSLINKNEFLISRSEESDIEGVVSLLVSYYDSTGELPREVMLGFDMPEEDRELLSEYLSLNTPYKVAVKIPERGDGRALCEMAYKNAEEALRQSILEGEREDRNVRRLSELLGLEDMPKRIEAYDISNIGNENIVASMVVWADGRLKKSDYRLFNIKSTAGQDDYGSMREALTRRLAHIGEGTLSLGDQPDLILVDGGDGHVGVAKEVLYSLDLDIPVFGMVKDDYHKTRALTNGESEISIAKEFNVYAFIYNLQEEAHRFAVKSSQKAKTKTLTKSSLERIEGIGPAKAKKLLSKMPLSKIRAADVRELQETGISKKDAESIYNYYRKK